ncbi:uncharacterized protein LOC123673349 [Harmonia axyridis]|uniref:uncharacterized protein LOC123673349 n=1 Tax=Harmonia axyridis TaxID=115357 RepID=UPI001E27868C|nr:uncharacterized protein LOC123673349 [Harmonia axyridis]
MLMGEGFELRNFSSNEPPILTDLCGSEGNSIKHLVNESQSTETLGIYWNSTSDCFIYNSQLSLDYPNPVTKRNILSTISQIFDPLGLLGPVIVQAKILLQQLWLANLNWDDPISTNLNKAWIHFCKQLQRANILEIPRHVIQRDPISVQIHGFCDASIQAYGACIYLRSQNSNLLCAKSRVAPLKTIFFPRLVLSGALLVSKLVNEVIQSMNLNFESVYHWTDSTIVLAWLSAEPRTWKTFVSNRISEIQGLSDNNNWNHVPSKENPADIITRGINPTDHEGANLWWHGPHFLNKSSDNWPQERHISNYSRTASTLDEYNQNHTFMLMSGNNFISERFSNYSEMKRVIIYCLRFAEKSRGKQDTEMNSLKMSPFEWQNTKNLLLKLVQADDLKDSTSTKSFKFSSCLKSLNPFSDTNGILRVRGRMEHANVSPDTKHPILIPKKHQFTAMLVRHVHEINFHFGCQATLSFIRRRFWSLNGRDAVRNILHQCIPCFRANPPIPSNQMGNLPAPRVTPSRVFSNCGLNYAAPFRLKDGKYKNRKILKCYVCIFVCLSTKAIHIELVSELTTEAFMAAFKRFVSRRGMCTNLYSDNGSNFIGARNKFKEIYKILSSKPIQNHFENTQMQWHFIPARSAHFEGLWKAAVKSVKHHLKRILFTDHYTYEEFMTILTQIEVTLNSRPLVPLSFDPNDLEAITPGHFIIGEPLNAAPQLSVDDTKLHHLNRFQHSQKLVQSSWTRWRNDYLHNLHQSPERQFKKEVKELIGRLVLLRDEHSLPQQCALGRITSVHPETDNIVRVVSVRTKNGIVKKTICKIRILPVN